MKCPKCESANVILQDDSFDHDWNGGGTEIIKYYTCGDCGYGEKDGEDDFPDEDEVLEE